MATEVYTTEEIKLLDGTEVVLKPLAIRPLRKFMRIWNEFLVTIRDNGQKPEDEQLSESEVSDLQFDTFTDMCMLCLSVLRKDRDEDEFRAYIEDTLDEQTIYRVLDKCGGLKLNDPNLQAASLATA